MSHMGLAIIRTLSLTESLWTHESNRNKDVFSVRRRLRLVKVRYTVHNHRNMDALDSCVV